MGEVTPRETRFSLSLLPVSRGSPGNPLKEIDMPIPVRRGFFVVQPQPDLPTLANFIESVICSPKLTGLSPCSIAYYLVRMPEGGVDLV
jgi:hypothetical protein